MDFFSKKKQIRIENKNIDYTLRRSRRARSMRVAVYCDGSVVVTSPLHLEETLVERFLREKAEWLFSKITFFREFTGPVLPRSTKKHYLQYKEAAEALALERLAHFNTVYQFPFKKINIRNQKTRWGSCSTKGNLNFNYKIALLPKRLSDYIIAHELCHLGEFNHSEKFWHLVGETIPDHVAIRKELKKSRVNFR